MRFFGVKDIIDVYEPLTNRSSELNERYRRYAPRASTPRPGEIPKRKRAPAHRQLQALCSRYLRLVINDRQRLLLLLIQAPLLALLISFVANGNGLVLVGWSEDFKYEIIENSLYDSITNTYDEPYPVIYTIWDQVSYDIGNRAMGTLIFVRSDYVMNNYFSENQRIVELYNGVVFKNYAGRWNGITAKYEDYKY